MADKAAGSMSSISFALDAEQEKAVKALAAGRKTRLSGEIKDGRFVVDNVSFARESFSNPLFVAVNAPFLTGRA